MVWTEKCTVWVSVLILCIQQPDSLSGKAILQSACAWSDAAETSAWGQQERTVHGLSGWWSSGLSSCTACVDVLEGGKLTYYSVAGSSDIPLQSLATAAVSIPGGDAAGQNALLSAGVEWVEDVGTHSKFPQAPEEMRRCCAISTIHLKLLSFADVEWEVVFLAPACQSMHLFSVGRLIIDMWTWRILLKPASHICTQAMLPALEAILGHRSAHSLVTGPVIAEPTKDNKNYLVLHLRQKPRTSLKLQVSRRTCSTTDWDLTAHGDCHLTQQQWDYYSFIDDSPSHRADKASALRRIQHNILHS